MDYTPISDISATAYLAAIQAIFYCFGAVASMYVAWHGGKILLQALRGEGQFSSDDDGGDEKQFQQDWDDANKMDSYRDTWGDGGFPK